MISPKNVMLLGVVIFTTLNCAQNADETNYPANSNFDTTKIVGAWVDMWNTYDLTQVDNLFLTDANLTYFSSEKEGVIKGIEAVREHHVGFGFVAGGKEQDNKLWVENLNTTTFGSTVVVTGIWFFQRATGQIQRGPVTFVYVQKENDYRLAHLHFANYLDTRN